MADRIVFQYPDMESIASKIDGYATQYEQAAATLKSSMDGAIASWEGASKEKFNYLFSNSVYNYMYNSVPEMVKGLATLLRGNAQAMEEADAEIAKNIPDSI